MVKLEFTRCDGGDKGELCRDLILKACKSFFDCDIKTIEQICNENRETYLKDWKEKDRDEPMQDFHLSITYDQGINEITLPYKLEQPRKIEIQILEHVKPKEDREFPPMDIGPIDNFSSWILHVYLDSFHKSGNKLKWNGYQESIEDITYHELLHASGDNSWMGRHDGILRHNLIGINAVKQCIDKI